MRKDAVCVCVFGQLLCFEVLGSCGPDVLLRSTVWDNSCRGDCPPILTADRFFGLSPPAIF